ncbi:MAG: GumC family protein [Acidobacteriota bacterium]
MADVVKAEQSFPPSYVPETAYYPPFEVPREQSEVLRRYLYGLGKRKWLIVAVTLTVLAAAAIQTYTTTPMYTSTVQLQIEMESVNVLPYPDITQGPQYYYDFEGYQNTQYRLLKSRVLGQRVAKRLRLGEDKRFNVARSSGLLRELLPKLTAFLLSPFGSQKQASSSSARQAAKPDDGAMADRVVAGVTVTPDRGSRLASLSYSSPDPELAAAIVNQLADEYLEMHFETRFQAATLATDFLRKELDQLKIKVEKSDEALLAYAREHGIVADPSERESIAMQKLASLNAELTRVQADLITKTVQHESLQNATVQDFPERLKDETIRDLEGRISTLKQRLANLSSRYQPEYPELERTKREIFELEDQLVTKKQAALIKAKSDFELAQNQYRSLVATLEEQKLLANQLNQDAIQYNILKREVDSNKQLYEGLLQRLKEASVSAGLKSSNIHIVERGSVPKGPSSPVHRKNLMLGLVIGLLLGVSLAFVVDYFDNTVKTPDDLEQMLALPSLGIIPRISELVPPKRKALSGETDRQDLAVPCYLPVKAPVWEAYRSLRTSILLSHSDKPPRRILVTSAMPGEGKTTTAINTAIVLAQTGARTLLVDLDMRKPEVGRKFGVNGGQGMSIFLSGNSDLSSQILETPYSDLYVIPAGPVPPNPAELVGSPRWQKALKLLSDYFDYIVIDSPPVLSVADPIIISTQVDGVVLVVLAGKTAREAVRKARNAVQNVGASVLGAMINNVDLNDSNYSYYYKYYYSYGYYGREEEKAS